MGRKCSVVNCRTGYDPVQEGDDKVAIFRFPKDEEECRIWISCLPNKLDRITDYMGVCAFHWPANTHLVRKNRGRYPVPTVPPSIFPNVPGSCIPTHTSCTPRSTSSARNPPIDELALFRKNDRLKSAVFQDLFKDKFSSSGLLAFSDECIAVFSSDRTGSVHEYCVYLTLHREETEDLMSIKHQAFYRLKKNSHPALNNTLKYWSELEELIRYVVTFSETEEDYKLNFLCQSIHRYNIPKNSRIYSLQDLSLAFSWYSRSRALYTELRKHIQLPSLSTLQRITRVAKNLEDIKLFKSILSKMEERSKGCILIVDEVYVKASLTYRGGSIFGYAESLPRHFFA